MASKDTESMGKLGIQEKWRAYFFCIPSVIMRESFFPAAISHSSNRNSYLRSHHYEHHDRIQAQAYTAVVSNPDQAYNCRTESKNTRSSEGIYKPDIETRPSIIFISYFEIQGFDWLPRQKDNLKVDFNQLVKRYYCPQCAGFYQGNGAFSSPSPGMLLGK